MSEQAVKEQKERKINSELKEWVKSIALAVVIALVIRFFFFETFLVEGTSMYPTLRHHERLVVNKISYNFTNPEHGDIIVFKYANRRDFIKRAIAFGGDRVEIRENYLYVNGKRQIEPYIRGQKMRDFGSVIVPEGHVFVLGDNRNNSMDSRDPAVGTISMERVKGEAMFVFWPFSRAGMVNTTSMDISLTR